MRTPFPSISDPVASPARPRRLFAGALLSLAAGAAASAPSPSDPGEAAVPPWPAVPLADGPGAAGPAPLPTPRMIETGVGRLAVRVLGDGPRTLLLWPSILADHTVYRAQIEAWRARHRLVVVDGPGHGDSGPPTGPFTMAACAAAAATVLDALGEDRRVVLVGTSWGGLVAGEFALAHPGRTAAVVMLNTPVHAPVAGGSLTDRFVVWGARWLHGTHLYTDGVARSFFLPQTIAAGDGRLAAFHRHLHRADGAALASAVRSVLIGREALAPRMPQIAAPTLVIAGTEDAMYPPRTLQEAAARLPRGRFEAVPSRHVSVVDAPQLTTGLIDRFLADLPTD